MFIHDLAHAQAQLQVISVSKSFQGRQILSDVTFTVASGQRLGLIGENGSGKSTLLKIIAAQIEADSGEIRLLGTQAAPRVALLAQQVPFNLENTIGETIAEAVAPIKAAAEAVSNCAEQLALQPNSETVADSFDEALATAEMLDAWNVDSKISEMLAGFGLGGIELDRKCGELSGGQLARLSLSYLLLSRPFVLLLDEPTNHLDNDAINYLRQMLVEWPGPVLLASHDRLFLDETVTGLIDLDPVAFAHRADHKNDTANGVVEIGGSFSDYLGQQQLARDKWEAQFATEQAELKRLRAEIRDRQNVGHSGAKPRSESRITKKFYADRNAKVVSRRVNDGRGRLQTLEAEQLRKPPARLNFNQEMVQHQGAPALDSHDVILAVSKLSFSNRLEEVSFSLNASEKLLITGGNGSGKSTLMRLIEGELSPSSGTINLKKGVSVGMLHQDTRFDQNKTLLKLSAAEAFAQSVGEEIAAKVSLSAMGLLAGKDSSRTVEELSLGQRRRLALAILLAKPPQLLLIDEVNNHLSLSLVTELESLIQHYPGAVVVSSHDRWLRQHWHGSHIHLD